MGKLTFHRWRDGYCAQTRHGDAADRSYFIKRAAGGGWELSWHNSLNSKDDHDGLDPWQRPTTCRTVEDAKRLASAWHAYRTRKLAEQAQARADGSAASPAGGHSIRARDVGPGMVVWNPYGGARGWAVVASEPRERPDGTIEFATVDGRTGLFQPDFRLHFDRAATERLAAEREAQRHSPAGKPPSHGEGEGAAGQLSLGTRCLASFLAATAATFPV